jgi:hypothetical protein
MNVKTINEWYNEELINFKNNVQEMVKEIFNETKQIEPLAFALIIKENELKISVLSGLGKFFYNPDGKVMAAEVMRKFNKETKPIAIAFVCEAWAKILDIDDAKPYVNADGILVNPLDERPSLAKDKKEIIMFTFETFDKEASVHYEINRNAYDENDVKIKKFLDLDWLPKKENHVNGLMTDLLEENYSEFAQMIKKLNNKENLN